VVNVVIAHGFTVIDAAIFAETNETTGMKPVVADGLVGQLPGAKILLELVEVPHVLFLLLIWVFGLRVYYTPFLSF
jgi:hypothetical protein